MSSEEAKASVVEPIWSRPEPGARRPAHSREAIARTAVAIADAEGLEAVSMRRVAAELGAGTMTLYHYVATKAELHTLMDDAIISDLLVPDDELSADWRDAISQIARRTRDVHTRHPWSQELRPQAHIGPNALRHIEQSLQAVSSTALGPAGRLEIIMLVDDYVLGYVARAGFAGGGSEDERAATGAWMAEYITAYLDQYDMPNVRELVGSGDVAAAILRLSAQMTAGDRFERGLQQLLDGIALDVQRQRGGA